MPRVALCTLGNGIDNFLLPGKNSGQRGVCLHLNLAKAILVLLGTPRFKCSVPRNSKYIKINTHGFFSHKIHTTGSACSEISLSAT